MKNETETQIRLRRAKEALESAREMEAHDRKALAESVERSKRMKEKYEELFTKEEQEEVQRLKGNDRRSSDGGWK